MPETGQDGDQAQLIREVLGEELRRIREDVGYTRKRVAINLDGGMHHQTIYHYEYGTRDLSLIRFVQLAMLLGVYAPDVLAAVLQRSRVDLSIVSLDPVAVLLDQAVPSPMRHWVQGVAHRADLIRLNMPEVYGLSDRLHIEVQQLIDLLVDLTPRPTSRHVGQ